MPKRMELTLAILSTVITLYKDKFSMCVVAKKLYLIY